MVQNIAIVGLDRHKSYEVAKTLASELDMYFFDALELFEFDNMPRTFSSVIKEFGAEYYRKKEEGIIKYASGFTNCVINLESGITGSDKNFEKIKQSSILIYLAEAANIVDETIKNQSFETEEEKKFFNVGYEALKERANILENESDIIVNAADGSQLKIVSEIIRMLKNYYKN